MKKTKKMTKSGGKIVSFQMNLGRHFNSTAKNSIQQERGKDLDCVEHLRHSLQSSSLLLLVSRFRRVETLVPIFLKEYNSLSITLGMVDPGLWPEKRTSQLLQTYNPLIARGKTGPYIYILYDIFLLQKPKKLSFFNA